MQALALSLIVLAASAAPAGASDVDGTTALSRPGLGKLNTGLLIVGGGVALSTASIVGGMWAAADQAKLDAKAATFRQEPQAANADALVAVRKEVGTSDVQALRDDVNLALIASGVLTMTIGWVVAAVGAAELTADEAP